MTLSNLEKYQRDFIRQSKIRDINRREDKRATKNGEDAGEALAPVVFAALVTLASLVILPVSTLMYVFYRSRHLGGRDVVTMNDKKAAMYSIATAARLLFIATLITFIALLIANGSSSQPDTDRIMWFIISVWVIAAIGLIALSAKSFALQMIGIVFDKTNQTISFPFGGILQSKGMPSRMETLPIASITDFDTSADRRVILHGELGTKILRFSSNDKRDEFRLIFRNALESQ